MKIKTVFVILVRCVMAAFYVIAPLTGYGDVYGELYCSCGFYEGPKELGDFNEDYADVRSLVYGISSLICAVLLLIPVQRGRILLKLFSIVVLLSCVIPIAHLRAIYVPVHQETYVLTFIYAALALYLCFFLTPRKSKP